MTSTRTEPRQIDWIAAALYQGHRLTPLVAATRYGIMSLTSRIAELRHEYGLPIVATSHVDLDHTRYKSYTGFSLAFCRRYEQLVKQGRLQKVSL